MSGHTEIGDTRLSPIEFYYYNLYNENPNSRALLFSKELQFSGLHLYPEEVVEILKLVLSLHPIAHTGFVTVKDPQTANIVVKRTILKVKEALDCHVILNLEDKTTLFDQMPIRTFDLAHKAPVKFAFSTQPHLILHLIFHRIGFDYRAAAIFVKNLVTVLRKLAKDEQIPEFNCEHSRQQFLDFDRYLISNFAPLSEFWKKKLPKKVTKPTFVNSKKIVLKRPGEDLQCSYISFTSFTSRKIMEMTIRYKITMLGLIISIYQLVLNFYSGMNAVTVVTETDLRSSIPGADKLVESLTNTIPLTAIFAKNDAPLGHFLSENEALIEECISMSAFPLSDMLPFIKKADRKNVIRHKVVEREAEVTNGNTISESKFRDVGLMHETALEFVYDVDRSVLSLQLHASSDIYSSSAVESILQDVAKTLRLISAGPVITVHQLKDHILHKKEFIDLFAMFTKVNVNDQRQEVLLSLTDGNGEDKSVLQWSTVGQNDLHILDFKDISNVHLITLPDGKGLWVKTIGGEEHKFLFVNKDNIPDWLQRLELILNFKITHV